MFREKDAEGGSTSPPPALIGCDELQLVIPWRVGLHQSPPPLHQPADSMRYSRPACRGFFSERQTVSYSTVSAAGSTALGIHLINMHQNRVFARQNTDTCRCYVSDVFQFIGICKHYINRIDSLFAFVAYDKIP